MRRAAPQLLLPSVQAATPPCMSRSTKPPLIAPTLNNHALHRMLHHNAARLDPNSRNEALHIGMLLQQDVVFSAVHLAAGSYSADAIVFKCLKVPMVYSLCAATRSGRRGDESEHSQERKECALQQVFDVVQRV